MAPLRLNLTDSQYDEVAIELDELIEIENFFWGNDNVSPAETRRLELRRMELRRNVSLSQRLREIVGPENEMRIVAHFNYATLQGDESSRKAQPAMFSNETLARLLNLSDRQAKQIDAMADSADAKRTALDRDLAKELHDLAKMYYAKVLQLLNTEQRVSLEDWHGSPIDWLALKNGSVLKDARKFLPDNQFLSVYPDEQPHELQVLIAEFSNQRISSRELVGLGVEVVDALWYEIMCCKDLEELVGLNEDQQSRLSDEIDRLRKTAVRTTRPAEPRLEQLLNAPLSTDRFSSFLTLEQLRQFRQIEFQVLMSGKYCSSFGTLHPSVEIKLNLDATAIVRIESLADEYAARRHELVEGHSARYEEASRETVREIAEILTDSQVQLFSRLTGIPIDELK